MSVTINGTTGVTTPAVASDAYTGPINVSSSAPDNSVTLAASGRLGIGTTSPANQLDVKNAGGGTAITCRTGTTAGGNWIDYYNASNSRQGIVGFLDSTNLYIYNDASAAITFSTAGTERARIDSSGNLLVGTTSNLGSGARLNVNYSFSNDGAAWKSDSTNTHNAIIFINPNGTVTYIPDPNFNGVDTFAYAICDTSNFCDTAIVIINVTPVNDPPDAVTDNASTTTNTAITIDVQNNDSDVDGDNLTTSIVTPPTNGTVTILNGDSIVYTPNNNYSGPDTIIYQICDDGVPVLCDIDTVFINVGVINGPPNAPDTTVVTIPNTPVTICTTITDPNAGDRKSTRLNSSH